MLPRTFAEAFGANCPARRVEQVGRHVVPVGRGQVSGDKPAPRAFGLLTLHVGPGASAQHVLDGWGHSSAEFPRALLQRLQPRLGGSRPGCGGIAGGDSHLVVDVHGTR